MSGDGGPAFPAWQPIETAPKDTQILVLDGRDIYLAEYFTELEAWGAHCGQPVVYTPEPEYWMPAPPRDALLAAREPSNG